MKNNSLSLSVAVGLAKTHRLIRSSSCFKKSRLWCVNKTTSHSRRRVSWGKLRGRLPSRWSLKRLKSNHPCLWHHSVKVREVFHQTKAWYLLRTILTSRQCRSHLSPSTSKCCNGCTLNWTSSPMKIKFCTSNSIRVTSASNNCWWSRRDWPS